MPGPYMPLTPAASTDITGTDKTEFLAEQSFELPPPAVQTHRNANASHHRPIQPANSPKYALPPPPTRSRTIIQMTPKPKSQNTAHASPQATAKGPSKRGTMGSNANSSTKKQPSSTSAAGKKMARKTAHSVIERRRRSKMNDEFATLKNMIPACSGQEMHKLSILQASIDYLHYLESCITDLKAANDALLTPLVQPQAPPLRPHEDQVEDNDSDKQDQGEESEDEDEHMEYAQPVGAESAVSTEDRHGMSVYYSPESMASSPAFERPPQPYQSSHSSSISTLPSPAFGPQHKYSHSQQSHPALSPTSISTSPVIMPSREQDEEATAALLMLNKDRRYSTSREKGTRGLSVRDLLSH